MTDTSNGVPGNSKLIVTALHKKMYEQFNQRLTEMARKKILEGISSGQLFGLIMDLDDRIWRAHIDMGPHVSPPGPPNPLGTVKRAFFGIVRRSEIQHIIDMLPAFESYFSEPPRLGHIPVLVLAAGMASPYSVHWGAELEFEWE